MIVTGGENVYSAEVERVIYRHPNILEAAVIGLPDEKWGERVTAVVVLKNNKDEIREEMHACFNIFTNFRNKIERISSDGDTVWVEFKYTGEVSGKALVSIMSRYYGEEEAGNKFGASDTVKSFELPHVYILDFEDGNVKKWTCYYNSDLLVNQLKD